MTKISKALAFLAANPGTTPYAAAKHAGLDDQNLYRHLKRLKAGYVGKPRATGAKCPVCGRSTKTLRGEGSGTQS